jgi:hypothetical protein
VREADCGICVRQGDIPRGLVGAIASLRDDHNTRANVPTRDACSKNVTTNHRHQAMATAASRLGRQAAVVLVLY